MFGIFGKIVILVAWAIVIGAFYHYRTKSPKIRVKWNGRGWVIQSRKLMGIRWRPISDENIPWLYAKMGRKSEFDDIADIMKVFVTNDVKEYTVEA